MKERPILFSAPMVRALLDGSKTQTRRLLNPQPVWVPNWGIEVGMNGAWRVGSPRAMGLSDRGDDWSATFDEEIIRRYATAEAYGWGARAGCPYGQPGGRLWVREVWRTIIEADAIKPSLMTPAYRLWLEADAPHQPGFGKLRPSMFMPRWASRITLEITGVRVERLQDISERDSQAEGVNLEGEGVFYAGVNGTASDTAKDSYRLLWEQINGAGSWDANPWAWVVEFKVLAAPANKEAA